MNAIELLNTTPADADPVVGRLAQKLRRDLRNPGHPLDARSWRAVERVLEYAAEAEQLIAEQARRIDFLELLSETDELTGLLNRRGFTSVLSRTIANAKRYGESGLLAYIDLNGFKEINDRYGHDAGDMVLRRVAELLRENLRDTDYVARLGGDEFAILFVRGEAHGAAARAEELRDRISSAQFTHQGARLGVGAAVGVTQYGPETTLDALLKTADAAMYRDKRACARAA